MKVPERLFFRELIDELKLSTDCFDGLILASNNTVRLQELARHLGIKIRAKVQVISKLCLIIFMDQNFMYVYKLIL